MPERGRRLPSPFDEPGFPEHAHGWRLLAGDAAPSGKSSVLGTESWDGDVGTVTEPPATPQAYTEVADFLRDLSREVMAAISWSRCAREMQMGRLHPQAPHLDLSPDHLRVLAQGGVIEIGPRRVSLPVIAANAELPQEDWAVLKEQTRSWRLDRLAQTPAEHSVQVFARAELGLPPLLALTLAGEVVFRFSDCCERVLSRAGFNHRRGDWATVRDYFRLFGDEKGDWLRDDAEALFGPDSPLVTRGLAHISSAGAQTPLLQQHPAINNAFMDELLGRGLDVTMRLPGVTLAYPTEQFSDIVVPPRAEEQLRSIDVTWPESNGNRQALGVLLHGESGVGKTLAARVIAGAAGRPLMLMSGSRHDEDEDAALVYDLVRRAATEQAILFIDEADDVVPEHSEASRALLICLENHPAVVILATNQPERLDPSIDRRLQIKIQFGQPGPRERARILRMELRKQAPPMVEGLLADTDLDRLAESARLAGGFWHNVVTVAAMVAGMRDEGERAVTIDDLAKATRSQTGDTSPLRRPRQWIEWQDQTLPLDQAGLGPLRLRQVQNLVAGLQHLRSQRSALGAFGIGCCIVLTGPEWQLGQAIAEGLAHAMRLPLGVGKAPPESERSTKPGRILFKQQLAQQLRHEHDDERAPFGDDDGEAAHDDAVRVLLMEDIACFMEELGELAVVSIACQAKHYDQWHPVVRRLATSQHLLVLHIANGPVPSEVTRLATVIQPWAIMDPDTRQYRWQQLGGTGPVPHSRDLPELHAALARQFLTQGGYQQAARTSILP